MSLGKASTLFSGSTKIVSGGAIGSTFLRIGSTSLGLTSGISFFSAINGTGTGFGSVEVCGSNVCSDDLLATEDKTSNKSVPLDLMVSVSISSILIGEIFGFLLIIGVKIGFSSASGVFRTSSVEVEGIMGSSVTSEILVINSEGIGINSVSNSTGFIVSGFSAGKDVNFASSSAIFIISGFSVGMGVNFTSSSSNSSSFEGI